MKQKNTKRIAAWLSLLVTLVSVIGTGRAADSEFNLAVAMSFLTIFLIVTNIVLFASSRTSNQTSAQNPKVGSTPTPQSPTSSTAPQELHPGSNPVEPTQTRSNGASVGVFVFAGITGAVSLFCVLDLYSGRYEGSGGMGAIIPLSVLAVTVPATIILLIVALALKAVKK
ncbi:MAG: hypothetical protein RLZZ06_662 [Actinomycetota bacterium]